MGFSPCTDLYVPMELSIYILYFINLICNPEYQMILTVHKQVRLFVRFMSDMIPLRKLQRSKSHRAPEEPSRPHS